MNYRELGLPIPEQDSEWKRFPENPLERAWRIMRHDNNIVGFFISPSWGNLGRTLASIRDLEDEVLHIASVREPGLQAQDQLLPEFQKLLKKFPKLQEAYAFHSFTTPVDLKTLRDAGMEKPLTDFLFMDKRSVGGIVSVEIGQKGLRLANYYSPRAEVKFELGERNVISEKGNFNVSASFDYSVSPESIIASQQALLADAHDYLKNQGNVRTWGEARSLHEVGFGYRVAKSVINAGNVIADAYLANLTTDQKTA